jgi:hypothetical protein
MAADSATWQHYFEKWGPSLLLFARQQTGFISGADDIVQEAFIKIWKTYGQNSSITKSFFTPQSEQRLSIMLDQTIAGKSESIGYSKAEKAIWNYLKDIWKSRNEIPYSKMRFSSFPRTNKRLLFSKSGENLHIRKSQIS